jgi:transposase
MRPSHERLIQQARHVVERAGHGLSDWPRRKPPHQQVCLVSERTAVINQMRGFLLERGIIVRQGLRFLRQGLPDILAKRTDVLSPRMVRIIADLASDWRQLDERTTSWHGSPGPCWHRSVFDDVDRALIARKRWEAHQADRHLLWVTWTRPRM